MIVVHYTAIPTLQRTLDFFQPSLLNREFRKDIAQGGGVNVSVHYVIDTFGALYQLAPEDVICRLGAPLAGAFTVGGAAGQVQKSLPEGSTSLTKRAGQYYMVAFLLPE